jgi:signal peptidase I
MSGGGAIEKTSLDSADAAFVDVVTDLLRWGHTVRVRIRGGSMHPTFRDGEAITVTPAEPVAVRRGDVILYRCGRAVIAHRVVCVVRGAGRERSFVARGDSSAAPDGPVHASSVLGRVVAVERGRRIVRLAGWRARFVGAVLRRAMYLARWLRGRRVET